MNNAATTQLTNEEILEIVTKTVVLNKDKWSWLSGFNAIQLQKVSSRVAADITNGVKRSNRTSKRLGLDMWCISPELIAACVANLSLGHAGFISG